MTPHTQLSKRDLLLQIRSGALTMAGHKGLKIYGRLDCWSGKKMYAKNRVFFKDGQEALDMRFRPCGHCMKEAYTLWKAKQ